MAITASGVVSSVPSGANFDYTIKLSNSSFEHRRHRHVLVCLGALGQDYLATSPISVTPPAGWTDKIVHSGTYGATDGYCHRVSFRQFDL